MEFAAKDNFKEACRCYIAHALGRPMAININIKIPTPLPNKRMIGRWILRDTLGVNSYKKVFFALD